MLATLEQHQGENRFEFKANAGPSTQFVLLFSDEDRNSLTIDEVLAFYLIDVAERCKKSPPLQTNEDATAATNGNASKDTGGKSQGGQTAPGGKNSAANKAATAAAAAAAEQVNLERNNYHFYMTICVFIQLYRSCLNDTIKATFSGNLGMGSSQRDSS